MGRAGVVSVIVSAYSMSASFPSTAQPMIDRNETKMQVLWDLGRKLLMVILNTRAPTSLLR